MLLVCGCRRHPTTHAAGASQLRPGVNTVHAAPRSSFKRRSAGSLSQLDLRFAANKPDQICIGSTLVSSSFPHLPPMHFACVQWRSLPSSSSPTTAITTLTSHLHGEQPDGDEATVPSSTVAALLCCVTLGYANEYENGLYKRKIDVLSGVDFIAHFNFVDNFVTSCSR